MTLEQPINPNYAAIVTTLQEFYPLEGCDNIKSTNCYGNPVIVGKDRQSGDLGLFFPVETELSEEFLSKNNLFRKPELNEDKTSKGYFDINRRVRAVKLRGHSSCGLWLPLDCLNYLEINLNNLKEGMSFDRINGKEICRKYTVKLQTTQIPGQPKSKFKQSIPAYFEFHYDTQHLGRNLDRIYPQSSIVITDKWHGTSAIFANVPSTRPLTWKEKIAKFFGVSVETTHYKFLWASRTVVKGIDDVSKPGNHFYGEDIWGIEASYIRNQIPSGFSVYGEIVGYTPSGAPIQKTGAGNYVYGCLPNSRRFVVYRVTYTCLSGTIIELGWTALEDFCNKYGFEHVPVLMRGLAKDITPYPPGISIEEWRKLFLNDILQTYVEGRKCEWHDGKVPAEGIVVRLDGVFKSQAFKAKSQEFLMGETKALDLGIVSPEEDDA